MDRQAFSQYLHGRNLPAPEIEQHLLLAEKYDAFLVAKTLPPSLETTRAFVDALLAGQSDTLENLYALARYGRFTHDNVTYLAALEMLDGGEVMNNLYARLAEMVGIPLRDQVFDGVSLPTWGMPNTRKAQLMRMVMQRLESLVDAQTVQRLLLACLRDLRDEWYLDGRQKYQQAGGFDAYLELKRQEFIAELEEIKNQGSLYFNQEITAEVIDFVRDNPEVAQGVRQGSLLYVTKIPYLAKEYLAESDDEKKRYYACHCPWARETLIGGQERVSATFCRCSAGFVKKPWEIIFGQTLDVDVLESALLGDLRCRFAIHLPEGVV